MSLLAAKGGDEAVLLCDPVGLGELDVVEVGLELAVAEGEMLNDPVFDDEDGLGLTVGGTEATKVFTDPPVAIADATAASKFAGLGVSAAMTTTQEGIA